MRKEGNLMACTVADFAKYLKDNIVTDDFGEFISLPECDFCIIVNDDTQLTLEEMRAKAEGWYGLKVVDGGFNSDCLVVMADYYGGGCAHIAQIWNDGFGPSDVTTQDLAELIEYTLCEREMAYSDTILLVEIPEKKRYIVRLKELLHAQIEVYAENEKQANQIAMDKYRNSDMIWMNSEQVNITVEEANR